MALSFNMLARHLLAQGRRQISRSEVLYSGAGSMDVPHEEYPFARRAAACREVYGRLTRVGLPTSNVNYLLIRICIKRDQIPMFQFSYRGYHFSMDNYTGASTLCFSYRVFGSGSSLHHLVARHGDNRLSGRDLEYRPTATWLATIIF